MQKKNFTLHFPLSDTSTFMGQISINGTYWMEEGSLMCDIDTVLHSSVSNPSPTEWLYIPNTFWTWLDTGDRIGEIAYEHCKYLMQQDQPDTTTDMGQDHYCQVNNLID